MVRYVENYAILEVVKIKHKTDLLCTICFGELSFNEYIIKLSDNRVVHHSCIDRKVIVEDRFDLQKPDDEMIIFTEEIFIAGVSSRGALNGKQKVLLFGCIDAPGGWRKRLIGSQVTRSKVDKYLALKDTHIKFKRK